MPGHLSLLIREENSPLFVVTARDGGERSGCVVGFVTQCSIYPERLLVCLSRLNHTYDVARRATALGVHLLTEADEDLARRFGELSGDDVDKFAGLATTDAGCGAPILPGERPWVAGSVEELVTLGDHVGIVIEPTESGGRPVREPLRMHAIKLEAGHPPDEEV